jgi:hypothetical protein
MLGLLFITVLHGCKSRSESTGAPPPQKKMDTFDQQARLSAPEHNHNLKIIYKKLFKDYNKGMRHLCIV